MVSGIRHHTKEKAMAKMCPLSGCHATKGLCIHDKMMMGMGAMMFFAAVAHWGLHLI